MTILVNNQETVMGMGSYVLKASGALDLQWDLDDGNGFNTVTGGSFTAASDNIITLPTCKLKVINAGANTLTIRIIR